MNNSMQHFMQNCYLCIQIFHVWFELNNLDDSTDDASTDDEEAVNRQIHFGVWMMIQAFQFNHLIDLHQINCQFYNKTTDTYINILNYFYGFN